MTTIKDIKMILESFGHKEQVKEEAECPFEKIVKNHADLPEEKVKEIIEEVKAVMSEKSESESEVDVKDAPDVDKPEKTDSLKAMNELCGSESEDELVEEEKEEETIEESEEAEDEVEDEDEVEEQVVTEDDEEEEVDDDLIISEEDEEAVDDEAIVTEEDEEDEEDDLLAEDADELDIADSDEEFEEDYLDECGDTDSKEAMHEANTAAKAAIANEFDGKGTFSSDIDVLTDYLKDY